MRVNVFVIISWLAITCYSIKYLLMFAVLKYGIVVSSNFSQMRVLSITCKQRSKIMFCHVTTDHRLLVVFRFLEAKAAPPSIN